MPRRERLFILGSLLTALEKERGRGDEFRLTNVAMRANIAYDRMHAHLAHLAALGLITSETPPRVTDKGREFLRQYRQWMQVLEDFGLAGLDNANGRSRDDS